MDFDCFAVIFFAIKIMLTFEIIRCDFHQYFLQTMRFTMPV